MVWRTDIITFLPDIYPSILEHGLIGKARQKGLWDLKVLDICDFSGHKSRSVDDTPAGGGSGMILKADVAARAIDRALSNGVRPVVYLSPAGKKFDRDMAVQWSKEQGIIFLCGRYEGIDERVLQARDVREVSLGDFVLCGGDVAAIAMIEATVRLLDGTIGDAKSLVHESFEDVLLEHPHYTKPRQWESYEIPDILLSGNHGAIASWRLEQAKQRTKERRSDLWQRYRHLCDGEKE